MSIVSRVCIEAVSEQKRQGDVPRLCQDRPTPHGIQRNVLLLLPEKVRCFWGDKHGTKRRRPVLESIFCLSDIVSSY